MSEFGSLTEEFNECRSLHESDIPDHIMESWKTDRSDFKLDSLWSFIQEMNDPAENALLFPRLWKVVRLILTTSHSNAEEERVFTIVRKNKSCGVW